MCLISGMNLKTRQLPAKVRSRSFSQADTPSARLTAVADGPWRAWVLSLLGSRGAQHKLFIEEEGRAVKSKLLRADVSCPNHKCAKDTRPSHLREAGRRAGASCQDQLPASSAKCHKDWAHTATRPSTEKESSTAENHRHITVPAGPPPS